MKRQCIFFQWMPEVKKTSYPYVIMYDAIKSGNLKMYCGPNVLRNKKWNKLHEKMCRKIGYLLYPIYLPPKMNRKIKYIFLFNEFHPLLLNLGFFKWIKKKYDVKTVLVLRNMIKNKRYPTICGIELNKLKQTFDLIVTDEKGDAELFNLFYQPDSFSNIYKREKITEDDICFIGLDKGRRRILKDIAVSGLQNGVRCNIKVIGKKSETSVLEYSEYQSYIEILRQDMRANCILEVLQPGQDSSTLRLQEAVCLGKKLLTNNKNVKNEKYYNPKYIQIFEHIDDINWDFVKEKLEVDYKYEGEYSPIHFLEEIERQLEKTEENIIFR